MERLQKVIARAGVASRRAAEEIILAGRVRVNGRVVTELGAKADPYKDKIEVDGQRLVAETPVYIVLHKPKNVVSTLSDPEGRPTVAEYLSGAGARVFPVGRLDFATSGVLLATNDGDFMNGLLHPSGGVPKTYVVKVHGLMNQEDLDVWRQGVELDDGVTLPAEARLLRHEGDKTWFEVGLREGRNQQIRRMGEATHFSVMRLARTSFAGITSEGLRPGEWRHLTVDELRDLRERFGVPKRVRRALGATHGPAQPVQGAGRGHTGGPRRAARFTGGDSRHTGSERRGAERPGTERRGAERQGTERRGAERQGTERRGAERQGTERRGAERPGTERRGAERPGTERRGAERPGTERRGAERPGTERRGAERPGTERRGAERPGTDRRSADRPGTERPAEGASRARARGTRDTADGRLASTRGPAAAGPRRNESGSRSDRGRGGAPRERRGR